MSEEKSGVAGCAIVAGGLIITTFLGVVGIAVLDEKEPPSACSAASAVSVDVANLPEVPGFTPDQVRNAAIIADVGEKFGGGEQGQIIGLITAMQESQLGSHPSTFSPDENGDAGLFQQRQLDGWYGSLTDVNDPAYAANAFYNGVTAESAGDYGSAGGGSGYGHIIGLKDISGWQNMTPTEAAASVQRPAKQYRGEYAKHEAGARKLLAAFSQAGTTVGSDAGGASAASDAGGASAGTGCGNGVEGAPNGTVQAVLDKANSYEGQGLVYSLGSGTLEGPTGGGLDCSSFVGSSWKAGAGVTFGRSAREQWSNLAPYRVTPDQIQPGDLIFEAWGTRLAPGTVSHVAMYVGDGQMVEWSRSKNGYARGPARLDGYQFVGIARPPLNETAQEAP